MAARLSHLRYVLRWPFGVTIMASISPSDSLRLHEFLAKGPDRFNVWFPAAMTLGAVVLVQTIEWFRRRADVRNTERRFLMERWWEHRYAAYSQVSAHIGRVRTALIKCVEELQDTSELTEDAVSSLKSRWSQAAEALGEIANQELLLSEEAGACLRGMQHELAKLDEKDDEDIIRAMTDCGRALGVAVKRFTAITRSDLDAVRPRRGSGGA